MNVKLLDNIETVLEIKWLEFKRLGLDRLEVDEILDAVNHLKWRNSRPDNISQIVDDILSIDSNTLMNYLSSQAIIKGSKMKLEDFEGLF